MATLSNYETAVRVIDRVNTKDDLMAFKVTVDGMLCLDMINENEHKDLIIQIHIKAGSI